MLQVEQVEQLLIRLREERRVVVGAGAVAVDVAIDRRGGRGGEEKVRREMRRGGGGIMGLLLGSRQEEL
jgi:NADPH-dependent glutamate synthase beta subunit-like oxidoreductase